jgi:hypothetical protein
MLREPEVQRRVHNSPKHVPIRSQLNPVHILSPYSCNICFNIVTSFTYISNKLSLFFRFTHQIRVSPPLVLHIPPTTHSLSIFRIIFVEDYKPRSVYLHKLLPSPLTSFPLHSNISLTNLFLNTCSLYSFLHFKLFFTPKLNSTFVLIWHPRSSITSLNFPWTKNRPGKHNDCQQLVKW